MKIYFDLKQKTEEWHKLRCDKFTASNATAIGNAGAGLKTLVDELTLNTLFTPEEDTGWKGADIERGNELEDIARTKYIYEHKIPIIEVGFIQLDDYTGFSPDGIHYTDKIVSGVEIKARNNKNHYNLLRYGAIESDVVWQCQMALFISGAEFWDYISYNPNFSERNRMFEHRIFPDQEKFNKIAIGLAKGREMLLENLNQEFIKNEQLQRK